MKIYITGISGFLSINLVRHFLANGYDDIAGIDLVDFDYPERDHVKFLKGDIRNKEDLRKSMKAADVVVHTAAAFRFIRQKRSTRPILKAPAMCLSRRANTA